MVSRYHNPAEEIPLIGRKLVPGSFSSLMQQVGNNEVLLGYYLNRTLAQVASYVDSEQRLSEIREGCLREEDGSYAQIEFYAVDSLRVSLE